MEMFSDFTVGGEREAAGEPQTEEERREDGFFALRAGDRCFFVIMIVGQVEGHYLLPPQNKTTKYEHVIPRVVAADNDPQIDGLLLLLNTIGGDIEAGLAIAELVAGMRKPTASLVIGGGHSIGIPLAVAADRSFMARTATMTVHPVRMNGMVLGVPQAFEYFRSIQERIVGFVSRNSGIGEDRFRALMMNSGELVTDLGTVLNGERAVEEGIIDALGGIADAVGYLSERCRERKDGE